MPPPLLIPAPRSAPVYQAGTAFLALGLAATIGLTLAIAVVAPERALLVPVAVGALLAFGWLARLPNASIYAALALSVLALNKETGLQPNQIAYGVFAYAILGLWYIRRIASGERFIYGAIDRMIAILLFIGLPASILIGLALDADLVWMRGEVIAFSMLAFYFPVKEIARSVDRGPEILMGIIIFIALAVSVRNLMSFREIVLSATEAWQIADARPGQGRGMNFNEMQLMAGALAALVLFLYCRTGRMRLLNLCLLGLFVFGLVMTRSRGYWVAFALGAAVLFLLVSNRRRWQMMAVIIGGSSISVLAVYVILGPVVLDLLVSGTLERFRTLETATTADISLVNRFAESRSAIADGMASPILGMGLGSYYVHYDLVYRFTRVDFFIHNGYVALWFKHGLWGLALVLGAWGLSIWQGWRVFSSGRAYGMHGAIALAALIWLVAIIMSASTSNPFAIRDQMFFFAIYLALSAGLFQRYRSAIAEAPAPISLSGTAS